MVPASLAAVLAVEQKIAALPPVGELTRAQAQMVVAVRAMFDALTIQQQEQVSNLSVLEAAEDEIERLTKIYESERTTAAQAVVQAIDAIGVVDETNYESKKGLIDAAGIALQEYEKTYGTDEDTAALITNLQALVDAREAYDLYANLSTITYGDINGDGSINANDALLALQHSVQLSILTGDGLDAADVDDNGKVDASDALLILQRSVQLIDRFPAEQS